MSSYSPNAKPRNSPKTGRRKVGLEQSKQKAFELRRDGASISEVAAALNVTTRTAFAYISERLNEIAIHNQETLGQIKAMSDARLLKLIRALMPKANRGDTAAARAIVYVEERRAKLLGLDAPVRTEIDLTVNAGRRDIDAEIAEVIDISTVARKDPQLVAGTEVPLSVETEGEGEPVTAEGGLAGMDADSRERLRKNHNGSGGNGLPGN